MNQHHSLPESCANTVPIKVNRVFDSCSDRDCFSNIQIHGRRSTAGEYYNGQKSVRSCVRHLHEY